MRRTIGIIVASLGVLALVASLVIWAWVAPNVVKLPTDTTAKSVAEGNGSGLNLATAQPFRDIELTATRNLTTDEDASDDNVVVWTMNVRLTDPTGNALTAYTDRVAVDRETVRAVNNSKYNEEINDERFGVRKVKHKGLSYHFPFHTKKKEYLVFEANTGKAFPAKYEKKEKLEGQTIYKFVQQVPPTKVREAQVPGAAIGAPVATVTADVYYTNVRTFWVEPVSGWIVKASENAKTTLRAPNSNEDRVVVLANQLVFNDDTVERLSDRAKDDKNDINLIENNLPLWLLIGGLVLLVLGVILFFTGRRRGRRSAESSEMPTTT